MESKRGTRAFNLSCHLSGRSTHTCLLESCNRLIFNKCVPNLKRRKVLQVNITDLLEKSDQGYRQNTEAEALQYT